MIIAQIIFLLFFVGLGLIIAGALSPKRPRSVSENNPKGLTKKMIAAGIVIDVQSARECLKDLAERSKGMDISGFKEFIAEVQEEDFDDKVKVCILIRDAISKVQMYRANHIDVDCEAILSRLILLAQLTK